MIFTIPQIKMWHVSRKQKVTTVTFTNRSVCGIKMIKTRIITFWWFYIVHVFRTFSMSVNFTITASQQNGAWTNDHTEQVLFITFPVNSYGTQDLKGRQSKSCGHGGRSPHWDSQLPTLWSGGTLLSPAGTGVRGSWEAHRRSRPHLALGLSGLLADASGQAGWPYPQCTPTSGHWSQDAQRHEPWMY